MALRRPGKIRISDSWLTQLRVHWNFLRVVLPQFKVSIVVFVCANLLGGLILWSDPALQSASGESMTFAHAAYTALALNVFEVSEGFPQHGNFATQATYFLLPTVGLLVIAEGLMRLGVVILNRKRLSEEWHMALASTFKNHTIIVGLGKIGGRVAQSLEHDENLVCIELVKDRAQQVGLTENTALVFGDASSPAVLSKANVAKARAIIILTDNDLANLEIALNAREVNPEIKVVLRMFNERLGKQFVETFGFQSVFSTAALAAPSFSSALYSSKILQTIEIGSKRRVHLAKLSLDPKSPLVGKSILELEEGSNVSVVLHHTQGRDDLLPAIDHRVLAGDEVFVLAELDALDAFDRLTQGKT